MYSVEERDRKRRWARAGEADYSTSEADDMRREEGSTSEADDMRSRRQKKRSRRQGKRSRR
jgi:hypothetical protein